MSTPARTVPAEQRPYGVVVPVKPPALAKSRLAPLGDAVRRELAAAMVADTVLAAQECPLVGAVLVVTDDVGLAHALTGLGASAIPDGRPGLLNETLALGAAELLRRRPHLRPVALCADLPALRAVALAEVLRAAAPGGPSFVADAEGSGTTLYTAPDLAAFRPRFGPGSRDAHRADGAAELAAPAGVRRDVDTPADLDDAAALGVGPRTAYVLTRLG